MAKKSKEKCQRVIEIPCPKGKKYKAEAIKPRKPNPWVVYLKFLSSLTRAPYGQLLTNLKARQGYARWKAKGFPFKANGFPDILKDKFTKQAVATSFDHPGFPLPSDQQAQVPYGDINPLQEFDEFEPEIPLVKKKRQPKINKQTAQETIVDEGPHGLEEEELPNTLLQIPKYQKPKPPGAKRRLVKEDLTEKTKKRAIFNKNIVEARKLQKQIDKKQFETQLAEKYAEKKEKRLTQARKKFDADELRRQAELEKLSQSTFKKEKKKQDRFKDIFG